MIKPKNKSQSAVKLDEMNSRAKKQIAMCDEIKKLNRKFIKGDMVAIVQFNSFWQRMDIEFLSRCRNERSIDGFDDIKHAIRHLEILENDELLADAKAVNRAALEYYNSIDKKAKRLIQELIDFEDDPKNS